MRFSFFANHRIVSDERGVTSIEYAAIAGIISIAAVAVMPQIGTQVRDSLSLAGSAFDGKVNPPAPPADGAPA